MLGVWERQGRAQRLEEEAHVHATGYVLDKQCSERKKVHAAVTDDHSHKRLFVPELISIWEDSRPVCLRILVPLKDDDAAVRSLRAVARRSLVSWSWTRVRTGSEALEETAKRRHF